jgi:CheY-like chemotaxis protein
LAGGVAHDFNNLLSIIIGYADLLLDSMSGEQRADIEGIQLAARRGASLTRQLLIFSRRQPVQPEIVNLNEVVTETDRLLRRTIGEDIDLVLDLRPDLRPIVIDRSRLEQILLNLVVNARAAMPEGGKLTISTAACQGNRHRVRLSVADTGVGMAPDVAERVFEPFFTTRAQGEGTGLGLATVYGAVTEAGGEVTLHTSPGCGTTFHIHFPAATAAPDLTIRAPERALHGNGETILLVEDDDDVRGIARRILTSAGYRVLEAAAPADALTISRDAEAVIDALLTDIIMPGMSGLDLARSLLQQHPTLPILFMTGYADPAILDQPLLTSSALLRKPFTAPNLLRGLRNVLDDA